MSAFAAAPILSSLVRSSFQGALVIAAVWLVCRLLPRLPATVRCGLWWLACARLLVGLLWAEPVRLALLPAPASSPSTVHAAELYPGSAGVPPALTMPSSGSTTPNPPFPWQTVFLAVWATGVLLLVGMTVWQHRRARRLVRRSEPVDEPWLAGLFADLRARLRVAEGSVLRLSPDVATPQVLGLMRPVVLLPASAPMRLSRPELAMTLCHELLHVRRGDLWLAWLPVLAQRLFFFHPLALLAAREYLLAREAACDAEVLRVLTPAPETYGRLLVRLGVTPGVPRLAAAGAAPSFRILKRRLQMLQNASQTTRLHPAWWGLVALAAVVALIPFTITAQAAPPAPAAKAALPVPAAAPQSALPVTPAAQHQKRALPPAPPVPPVPPRPPVPPVPPRTGTWMGSNHEESYVLLSGKNTFINGSWWDKAKVRMLRKSDDEEIFWFERGGKEYVIRDAAALRQIKALFEPQAELGKRQGALGEQQAKLGLQQAKLGSQQAEQGAKQAGVGAQMGRLGAELARLAQEGKSTDAVEAQLRELEGKQEEASRPQEDLSRQQEQLGRQQEELGHQQEELGRQQEKLAREAEKQLASLTANAISSGTAHELK